MRSQEDQARPTVVQVTAHLVDGGTQELAPENGQRLLDQVLSPGGLQDHLTGKELIQTYVSDDWSAPPLGVQLIVRVPADGRRAVTIPYDGTKVSVIRQRVKMALA